jgi:hypothetical protein
MQLIAKNHSRFIAKKKAARKRRPSEFQDRDKNISVSVSWRRAAPFYPEISSVLVGAASSRDQVAARCRSHGKKAYLTW